MRNEMGKELKRGALAATVYGAAAVYSCQICATVHVHVLETDAASSHVDSELF